MKTAVALVFGLLILSLLATVGSGQTTPQNSQQPRPRPSPTPIDAGDDDYEVVRVTSNLVVVPVSVTNTAGQPVLGLTAKDFRLEEGGRAQEIAEIGDAEQVPLEIAILLDVSGSVNARIDFEKEAAARFLKQVLKPADRATVFTIAINPHLELARATAEIASAKMMSIKSTRGPTAYYDTVIEAARYLANSTPPKSRRVIVVISDGEDNFSEKIKAAIGDTAEAQRDATAQTRRATFNKVQLEVQREIQRAEAAFYSINPSGQALHLNVISMRAQESMEQLANATGGTSFVPEKLTDLDAVFSQITAELRSQYLVQYYSKSEAPNGTFLPIKVLIPQQPNSRIRARQGYYVSRR
ncbi:MAG: VWA domain-containing protein [Acidobacteria bacterium]|nr:VWA domain-containing protein [Acidobacteriota bacterium]